MKNNILPFETKQSVNIGEYVKIIRDNENIWCRVMSLHGNTIKVQVDNITKKPTSHGLSYGAMVAITRDEVRGKKEKWWK